MESIYLTPELSQKYPYFSRGDAIIKAVVSEERDKFLAVASLAELGKYIPNIDTAKNVDLLGIAFNIFVANRFNKNDDVSDAQTSIAIAKLFRNKPINIEHKREKAVGFVTNYAFTKFGTNEAMSEEEASASSDPFNVTLGGIVWRVVNQKLAKLIEECSDPSSDHFEKISASWEVGFLDFAIAAVEGSSRNLSDAEIITAEDEIKALKGYMKAYGGKGSKGKKKLYRLIKGDALPLGVGLTGSPAGEVLGIATEITSEEQEPDDKENETEVEVDELEPDKGKASETTVTTAENVNPENDKNTKSISQSNENVVIQERKAIAMSVKITKIEDITDDLLKQATASEVTEWVKEQLKVADSNYQAEKSKLENDIKASKEAAEEIKTKATKLEEDLKKVNESLATLQAEKEARAKQDAFNTRMASLDEDFELADAEREVIASDIANMDDKSFEDYKKKIDVLLAAKKKKACATCGKKECKGGCKKETKASTQETQQQQQETKASTNEGKETVEQAIENADKNKEKLAAAASTADTTMLDKYSKAFGVDQWISDIKLTE